MEKYRLVWIDAYLLDDNWQSIENIKECYPVTDYSFDGGWVDCEHCYDFEAESLKQAKQIVTEYIDGIGRIIDVFSVIDKDGNVVFTEEDV